MASINITNNKPAQAALNLLRTLKEAERLGAAAERQRKACWAQRCEAVEQLDHLQAYWLVQDVRQLVISKRMLSARLGMTSLRRRRQAAEVA